MPPEIIALIDKPWLLAIVLAVGAACGIAVERLGEKMNRAERRAYWERRNATRRGPNPKTIERAERKQTTGVDLAADQLKSVSRASFSSRPLLNQREGQVFRSLDKIVVEHNTGWQVMAQVSLGEFLASKDEQAFFAINSKRVDFALMDEKCCVRHVLEYQGSGHHTGESAAARDAVKKEALRKAGIGYHEIVAGHTTPAELKRLVEKLVPVAMTAALAERSAPPGARVVRGEQNRPPPA